MRCLNNITRIFTLTYISKNLQTILLKQYYQTNPYCPSQSIFYLRWENILTLGLYRFSSLSRSLSLNVNVSSVHPFLFGLLFSKVQDQSLPHSTLFIVHSQTVLSSKSHTSTPLIDSWRAVQLALIQIYLYLWKLLFRLPRSWG